MIVVVGFSWDDCFFVFFKAFPVVTDICSRFLTGVTFGRLSLQ